MWKRLALAFAAMFLAALALASEPALGAPAPHAQVPMSEVTAAAPGATGIGLEWEAVAGADLYQVVMFSPSLEEIGRIETTKTIMLLSLSACLRGTSPPERCCSA